MARITNYRIIAFLAVFAAAAICMAGCGGGGGGSSTAPGGAAALNTAAGNGLISANVTFAGPPRARSAGADSGDIEITITITGVYSETGEEFPAQVATVSVPYNAAARVETVSLEVPIGFNHLLEATAAYPGGGSETVRSIIPEVAEGQVASVTANKRSTVIADAALALAEQQGVSLADVSQDHINRLASAVDTLYSSGTAYSDMNSTDLITYAFGDVADVAAVIEITPATATPALGASQTFTAAVKNAYGVTLGTDVTWSADAAIGAIDAAGVFTASAEGSGVVTAATGTVTATAAVTVVALGTVVSVAVSPDTVAALDAEIGDTITFTLTGTDAVGNSATLSGVTWTASGGLSATGNPGEFSVIDVGAQTVTGSYSGVSGSVTFTTITAAPQVQSPAMGSAVFGQSFSGMFSTVYGTAPFVFSISGGKLPSTWTFDTATGLVTGVFPNYVSAYSANIRVTDGLGRSTDMYTDGALGFQINISGEINEFINILQTADGALNSISDILQQMRALAVQEQASACPGGTGGCDAEYQTLKAQIDSIVSQATFNGAPLLDGTYVNGGLSVDLTGGGTPVTLEALIANHYTSALGISSTSLISPSMATGANALLDTAIATVNSTRGGLGAKNNAASAIISSFETILAYLPDSVCLQNLCNTASVASDLLSDVSNALQAMRTLAVQAQSGTLTTADKQALQADFEGWAEYLDILAASATFDGNLLVDGSLSQTCTDAGSPTITVIDSTPKGFNLDTVDLVNNAAAAQNSIDGAITSVNNQRATLQTDEAVIATLLP